MAPKQGNGSNREQRVTVKAYQGGFGTAREIVDRASQAWAEQPPSTLCDAIAAVTAVAGGLLCGATRDGGSVSVVLYYGDDKRRFYPNNAELLTDLLCDITAWAQGDVLELQFFD